MDCRAVDDYATATFKHELTPPTDEQSPQGCILPFILITFKADQAPLNLRSCYATERRVVSSQAYDNGDGGGGESRVCASD